MLSLLHKTNVTDMQKEIIATNSFHLLARKVKYEQATF